MNYKPRSFTMSQRLQDVLGATTAALQQAAADEDLGTLEEMLIMHRRITNQFPDLLEQEGLNSAEMALIREGKFIDAIKLNRQRTGSGLKEAKDRADKYRDEMRAKGLLRETSGL